LFSKVVMTGIPEWLRQAFALGDDPPSAPQMALVERLAVEIKRRQLTVPAIAFLEMSRPLSQLSAQALHFFNPILSAIFRAEDLRSWSEFLERRDALDLLMSALERQEEPEHDAPQ
jgi:hypothetical protein